MIRYILQKSSCIRLLSTPLVESLASHSSMTPTFEKPQIPSPLFARSSTPFHWVLRTSTTQANVSYAESRDSDSDSDSSSDDDTIRGRRREGVELLRSLNAYNFREHLKSLSQSRSFIRYDDMVALALQKGAAGTRAESMKLCNTLISAGVVFRFRDVVYLGTDEVAETILASLPDTKMESKKRMEELKAELKSLEAQKKDYDAHLDQYRTRMSVGLLALLVLHFGGFVRLTYWELSWDVMEPIAYFTTLAYGIAFLGYFVYTKEIFEIPKASSKAAAYLTRKHHYDYDKERYSQLLKEFQRFQKRGMRFRL